MGSAKKGLYGVLTNEPKVKVDIDRKRIMMTFRGKGVSGETKREDRIGIRNAGALCCP